MHPSWLAVPNRHMQVGLATARQLLRATVATVRCSTDLYLVGNLVHALHRYVREGQARIVQVAQITEARC
jgi:hypothetical protein